MKIDDLNEDDLNIILEIKTTFTPEDWETLGIIVNNPYLNDLEKTTQLETLKLQAHNKYVTTHGKQPNGGTDPNLENLL